MVEHQVCTLKMRVRFSHVSTNARWTIGKSPPLVITIYFWYNLTMEKNQRVKQYNRTYREKHKEAIRAENQARHLNVKNKILDHYGNECVHCGYSDFRALQLDHINNNGNVERKAVSKDGQRFSGWKFYDWVIKQGYPEGYQILCANCNTLKQYSSYKRALTSGLSR